MNIFLLKFDHHRRDNKHYFHFHFRHFLSNNSGMVKVFFCIKTTRKFLNFMSSWSCVTMPENRLITSEMLKSSLKSSALIFIRGALEIPSQLSLSLIFDYMCTAKRNFKWNEKWKLVSSPAIWKDFSSNTFDIWWSVITFVIIRNFQ
jgi:hypothetical protein